MSEFADRITIEAIDLLLGNSSVVVLGQLGFDLLPTRVILGHRKRTTLNFFNIPESLRFMSTCVRLLELIAMDILCEIPRSPKVIFLTLTSAKKNNLRTEQRPSGRVLFRYLNPETHVYLINESQVVRSCSHLRLP